jgi:hypothetical protein
MKIFPEKIAKKLPAEFADNINAMDTEEIKKKIIEADGNLYNINESLTTNEEILQAKENLKEMTAPFREGKAGENAKIAYCLWVLSERGVQIGVDKAE